MTKLQVYAPFWFRSRTEMKRRRFLRAGSELIVPKALALEKLVMAHPEAWSTEDGVDDVRIPVLLVVSVPEHAGRWTSEDGTIITLKRALMPVSGRYHPTVQDLIIASTEVRMAANRIAWFVAKVGKVRVETDFTSSREMYFNVTRPEG